VFKITPGGTLTTLHIFGFTDGAWPFGALVQGSDGDFYGTTNWGGTYWNGTVFKIGSGGTLSLLYSFCGENNGCSDGAAPTAGLVQATDGNFYGTARSYPDGPGTVFKITPSGTLTTLHTFDGTDGVAPYAGLVQGTDGNFYGTTEWGGAYYYGTVFRITPGGTLTTLHSFDSSAGDIPLGGMVQVRDGFLYGTTSQGGAYGYGTVFRLGVVRTCATCAP
jgi:uncharacterized repeat protein (TIGR03803 family)